VVCQTKGATALYVASQMGHVDCVWALLDGGAAINQAMVGSTSLMVEYCGGCVCVRADVLEAPCMRVQPVWCTRMAHGRGCGRVVVESMSYVLR
jgi:hypothetical protein